MLLQAVLGNNAVLRIKPRFYACKAVGKRLLIWVDISAPGLLSVLNSETALGGAQKITWY